MKTALRIAMALLLPVMLSQVAVSGDSIFDVEHARAEYRAGSLTREGADLMDRWGWPSGCYAPQPCYVPTPPPRPYYDRRSDWRARR